jgi:hypothetical protein
VLEKKTVITVDLGLYRPMQQLPMTLKESTYILLPGDLHIIMAQLRAIGCFIEMSGIPECGLRVAFTVIMSLIAYCKVNQ